MPLAQSFQRHEGDASPAADDKLKSTAGNG
jgi:hypothetical protein